MKTEYQARLESRSRPDEFQKTTSYFGATTQGVGALMGAGLYVLVGIAAAEAGPGLFIAYGICGALTALTVLLYGELARKMPVSGGGYVYAYRQLGSFWGFIVGWHLALGSVFACALYAVGFGAYLVSFFGAAAPSWTPTLLSALLVALLSAAALRGGKGGARLQGIFTWGNLAVILLLVAVAIPLARGSHFQPLLPKGLAGVGSAISLVYISFFGFQLIANGAEEVQDAERTVPRAMATSLSIAAAVYLLVAVVAVAAVGWSDLASSGAPLVVVAQRAVGPWGGWLIGLGGILASAAALNSTLVSQARQIYAMGRDRLLPERLGGLSPSSGVPVWALLGGALTTIAVLLLAELDFIAKAANFALLFAMLPLSFALHRLNRQQDRITLWRRALPWAALLANAGLLLTLDRESLFFGGTLVGIGCLVFLGYSYASERRGRAGYSVALADSNGAQGRLFRGERILLPMANPATQERLLSVAQALLPRDTGQVVLLSVVRAMPGERPREALRRHSSTQEALGLISHAADVAEQTGIDFVPVMRAANSLPEGIADASVEERCGLVIMGWASRDDGSPSRLLDEVVSRVRADLIFLQLTSDAPPRRVGVALGARSNLPLMVRAAAALAEDNAGEVVYLNVLPQYFSPNHLRHARRVHGEAIGRHTAMVPYRAEILRSDNPLAALVRRSEELDLLVIGSAQAGPYARGAVGSFSAMVAAQARCSVMIVRSTPSLGKVVPSNVEALRDLGAGITRRADRR